MAQVSECFTIGSVVSCVTCLNKELEGEVLAFDQQTKMLILKSPASNGQAKLNDIHMINLARVSDIKEKKEATPCTDTPQPLNLYRISTRTRNQVDEKRRMISALKAGVSIEGQNLYLAITKTIGDVTWSNADILVMKQVIISPPYRVQDVRLQNVDARGGAALNHGESRALIHVQKLVEKHYKDQQLQSAQATTPLAAAGNSSATASASPTPAAKQ